MNRQLLAPDVLNLAGLNLEFLADFPTVRREQAPELLRHLKATLAEAQIRVGREAALRGDAWPANVTVAKPATMAATEYSTCLSVIVPSYEKRRESHA